MASLWKHPQSKYWTACWTDSTGRRMKRSTKTTDKKLAQRLANTFEEESRNKRTASQARQVLSDIYRKLSGEDLPTMTVREFMDSYVERKRPEISPATLDYYEGHARRFNAWLGSKADGDIAAITRKEIGDYRAFIGAKASPRTTNNTLKAIRTFFAAAKKESLIVDDPAAAVETVRDRTESPRRAFTVDELKAILAHANDEWSSMIRFGLFTGQRLSDIATLTWQNVDAARNEIRLTTRKTGRRQAIPIPPALQSHIAGLAVPGDQKAPLHPLAFAQIGKGRAGPLSKQFGDILEAAGLRVPTTAQAGDARAKYELSFHSLRHTATSILKDAGIPASVVMSFIGHDSADVSSGYTHTGREALEKAAAAFPTL